MNAPCRSVDDFSYFASTVNTTNVAVDLTSKETDQTSDVPGDFKSWQAALSHACQTVDAEAFWKQIGSLIAARYPSLWVAVYRRNPEDADAGSQWQTLHRESGLDSALFNVCQHLAETVVHDKHVTHAVLPAKTAAQQLCLIAAPLASSHSSFLVVVSSCRSTLMPQLETDLQLAALNIANWDLDSLCEQRSQELQQLAALTELVSLLEGTDDCVQACQTLAQHLNRHFQADQVIVGLCSQGKSACQVAATSDTETIDHQSERMRLAQAVLQESIARGDVTTWPPWEGDRRHALRAHEQFSQYLPTNHLISAVLRDDGGKLQGAWLLLGSKTQFQPEDVVGFALASQRPLANAFRLIARAERNRLARWIHQTTHCVHNSKGRAILAVAGTVFLLLLVPVRYRVTGDIELQPISRRFVAAPFDGTLLKSYVEPGDLVETDRLLAQMDEREVEWESAGTEAELHRAAKEHAGYIASHESGKAKLAEHEVARLRMRSELLQNRVEHLEIRSPVQGIVVTGDLRKSEGMPLSVGQTLFEVAPLDEMTVEVAIPEDDARLVRVDSPIRIWLDAFPGQRWDSHVQRIHPRAELKDHENIFIAELTLVNSDARLRPGMRGQARIDTIVRPWGWNLFHKAGASALRWLGW